MDDKQLEVGAKLIVSTSGGDEEDEVTRVLVDAVDAGVWVVQTARNGRVIVMKGRDNSRWTRPIFDKQHSGYQRE